MSKNVSPIHQKIVDINKKITLEQEALENAGSSATRAAAKKRLARAWASLEVAQEELAKEEVAQGAATKKALAEAAAKKPGKKPVVAKPVSEVPSPSEAPEVSPQPTTGTVASPEKTSITDEELTEQVRIELEQRPDWKRLGAAGRKDAIYREVQARKVEGFKNSKNVGKPPRSPKPVKTPKAPKPVKEPKTPKAPAKEEDFTKGVWPSASRKKIPHSVKIIMDRKIENPHKEGKLAHSYFEAARAAKTVGDYAEQSPDYGYLWHWAGKGLLTLEGITVAKSS